MHSPLETRRQLRFLFDSQKLGPLCQHLGITPENLHHLLNHRTTDFVQTHWFLEAIRESLPVEWGQTFRGQATRSLNDENKNWQLSHPSEQITYQATGSIIVGADGVFSQVRREHQIRTNKQFHYRYPIVFYGAGFHVEPDEYRRFFKPILQNKFAEAAVVRDGARLSVRKERIIHAHLPGDPRRHQVAHLRLYYSKAASAAEFEAFHGYKINQWRSPFIGYQLTSVILDKLRAEFGKLPDMFERAIDAIKAAGYHQKMLCDTIWIPPSQLPTRLESGGKSIPCVLVGDAADAVPTVYDTFSITRVCSEAVLLGEIIAQAWKTEDGQLSNVAQMFYNRACHQWDLYRAFWLKHWDHLHDTPPGSLANPIKITESVGNHAEDPLGQSKYEATSQTRTADPETEEMVRRREQHRRLLHSKIGRDSTKSKPYAYETWKNKGMKAGTGRKSRNEPLQLAFTNTFVCEEEIAKPTRLDKFKPFDEDGLEDESSEP